MEIISSLVFKTFPKPNILFYVINSIILDVAQLRKKQIITEIVY